MTKKLTKESTERKIFMSFAEAMSWPTDPSCIQTSQPPAPDILYTGLESPLAFELVEICASDIAHETAKLKKTGGTFVVWTDDPTSDILKSKLEKSYVCEHPIHLLCYTNWRIISPDSTVTAEIASALAADTNNIFEKIWYFGESKIFGFSSSGQLSSITEVHKGCRPASL